MLTELKEATAKLCYHCDCTLSKEIEGNYFSDLTIKLETLFSGL